MKTEQQQQAETLYYQTDLSKTEIAKHIGVSRRTLHYWVRDNNWDYIKKCAQAMPVQLAENNYFIMARLQENILSPERAQKPVTVEEVNALYKLTMAICKLKDRCALNENLQMMTSFIEHTYAHTPAATTMLKPVIDDYLNAQAKQSSKPLSERISVRIPAPAEDPVEAELDREDFRAWEEEKMNSKLPNNEMNSAEDTEHENNINPAVGNTTPPPAKFADPATVPKGLHNNRAARRRMARMASAGAV